MKISTTINNAAIVARTLFVFVFKCFSRVLCSPHAYTATTHHQTQQHSTTTHHNNRKNHTLTSKQTLTSDVNRSIFPTNAHC